MKTLYLSTEEGNYENSITSAAEIIKNGGIVAIPTETVYGLGASALSDNAIKKVFAAKGRPQDNPLIVHISDIKMLESVARDIPEIALKCAEKFWPGPFTMVLSKKDTVAESVSAGLTTVAVRMPNHKTALDVIKKSGIPIAAPSANTSGAPSPTNFSHVIADLDNKIDAVLCDTECEVGVESTVVALFGKKPRLLRPGAVTLEQLREILPDIEVDKAILQSPKEGERVASPGMKYKHYAPKTETFLVEGEGFAEFVNKKENALAVCFSEEEKEIKGKKIVYGSSADYKTLAKNLFSVLRDADGFGCKEIYIHAPEKTGVGLAVYNRLIRAAGFKVVVL